MAFVVCRGPLKSYVVLVMFPLIKKVRLIGRVTRLERHKLNLYFVLEIRIANYLSKELSFVSGNCCSYIASAAATG